MSAQSVKFYKDRDWDGFYHSPEYAKFVSSMEGVSVDMMLHDSPYFGQVSGSLFANGIDIAFEDFQMRIQNPQKTSVGPSTAQLILLTAGVFLLS